MDRAIWATWYDLAADGRDAFLDWLHGAYLPGLVARPGYLWAASYRTNEGGPEMARVRGVMDRVGEPDVPGGTQYLTLVGAVEPATLLAPEVARREREETGTARAMLDRRSGVRTLLLNEAARVNGPAIAARPAGTTPGPTIQMGSLRMKEVADEHAIGAWYATYRLPAMAAMPGCIAARTFTSFAGWAKFAVLYEFTSLAARIEHFERGHEALGLDPGHPSNFVARSAIHTPGSPSVAERLWPPVDAA